MHCTSFLQPVTLPSLKTLILYQVDWQDAPGRFIDTLTLPALRRLRVFESLLQPDPVAALVSLVSRSGCNLQKLSIMGSRLGSGAYRNALPDVAYIVLHEPLGLGSAEDAGLAAESDVVNE
jgi:hypothetical protein